MSEQYGPGSRRLRDAICAGSSRVLVVVALLGGLFAMHGLHSGHASTSGVPTSTIDGVLAAQVVSVHGEHELTPPPSAVERFAGVAGDGLLASLAGCSAVCLPGQLPLRALCVAVLVGAVVWLLSRRPARKAHRPISRHSAHLRLRLRTPLRSAPDPLDWCISRT